MNTTSHLSLEELVAHAAGDPVVEGVAGMHLATCSRCQAEVATWAAVAGGARHLVATARPPAFADAALATGQNRLRPGRPRSRHRTVGLATAAAAVVVLIGAAVYALSAGGDSTGDHDPTVATMAGLTSTDCAHLKVTAGTLAKSGASGLTMRTLSGQAIPLTTTSATQITRLGTAPVAEGDITTGMPVFVQGTGNAAGDQLSADLIVPMPSQPRQPSLSPPSLPNLPRLPGMDDLDLDMSRVMARQGLALGTVTDTSAGGLTVTGMDGTTVRISTHPSTKVVKHQPISVDELEDDQRTVAVGTPQFDGTVQTTAILQNALPAGMMVWPPTTTGQHKFSNDLFSGLGCDATTIANIAILAISQL